jgi:ankyrin repeat protein
LKIIQYLIKNDADVNAKNTYDNTPLHAVCIEGLEDCAQALLEAGANIGQRTGTLTKSSTPLHLAAEYSHPNLVRYLIDEGADISLQNSEGKSCLETAMETNVGLSEHHKNKTIDILLEASNGDEYDDDNGERNGNDDGDSDSDNESKNVEQEEDVTSDDINVVENSTEPRLSEDMTGEAARIAAAKGRKAAAAKKKRQKKKKQQEQNDQPKGCKCTIA